MGKSAENERLKLHANFLNNLAVATIVSGFVLPIFKLYSTPEIRDLPIAQVFSLPGLWPSIKTVVGAIVIASLLRSLATMFLSKIQD